MKLLLKPMKLMLVLALSLSSAIQYQVQVTAQTKPPTTSKPAPPAKKPTSPQQGARPVFVWSKTPVGVGTIPGRKVGMGSRENCPAVETQLTALVPFKERVSASKQKDNSTPMDVWGLTTAERPTFWFYVPYINNVANLKAEFVLQDRAENDVYRQAIALRATPGVMGVALPSTVAPLKVGETYRWNFKVHCNTQQTASPLNNEQSVVQVDGDIQRVSLNPSVAKQLAAANPREKIAIYAASGIWYDPLTMLAQLRQANSKDVSLATDWQSLLQSIKLGDVAEAPLLN